jgi:tetratricopeptide (TPR) repeat protein
MRSISFKIVAALVVVATLLSGCDLKKMTKKYETVKYEVTPTVLETNGGKISVSIKGTIPAKYFGKKASVEFAPVLKYANGTTQLKSVTLQGEKVKGTGNSVTVIKKKSGGTFSYTDVIDYKPDMNKSELRVTAKATQKKKTATLGETKLADGVIYTSERIEKEGDIILADHNYQKETIITQSAEIFFAKNMTDLNLKNLPLNKDEANAAKLKSFVDFLQKEWKIKNIDIAAWASPEGEETNNQGLSDKRSKTADKYIKDQIKDIVRAKAKAKKEKVDEKKLDADMPTSTLSANGEDWNGFLKSIGTSTMKDKDKVVNVVNSETDPTKKEKAINDMVVIYPEIEDVVLPPLRRSSITINYYEPKKTDQQMAMLATTMPDSLKKEELLYAATLTEDLNTKLKIYDAATRIYANDWKGYNNAGYVCIQLGKIDDAKSYLEKANTLNANNGAVINNLGVAAAYNKEYDNAKAYFETAQGLGITEGYNMGAYYIKKGDYTAAVSSYGTRTCTHNIALAQLLSGNSSAAATTLECANPKSAAVYYLLAIVGARSGNTALIYENLPKAIAADAAYRDQARDDREFLKFNTSAEFLNAIK